MNKRRMKLGEIIELAYGKSLPEKNRISGLIPVYGSNGQVGTHNEHLFEDDTIIVGRKGSIGELVFVKGASWTIDTAYYIKLKSESIDLKFIYYLLKTLNLQELNQSTAIPGLNREQVYQKEVVIPSLGVQRRIVDILERGEQLREQREKANEAVEVLLNAIFEEMFGNPVTNDGNWAVAEFSTIVQLARTVISPERLNATHAYIGLEDIESNSGRILRSQSVKEAGLKSGKFSFDEKCILYGKLRPYLNKVARPDFSGVCSTDIIPIRVIDGKSNREFITQLLRHPIIVQMATERSQGANLPRLSPRDLAAFKVIAPPIKEQERFASVARSITHLQEKQRITTHDVDELFNALLSKAFNDDADGSLA